MERIRENRVSFRSAPALPRLSFGTKTRRVERMRWYVVEEREENERRDGPRRNRPTVPCYYLRSCGESAFQDPFLPSFLTRFFLLCIPLFLPILLLFLPGSIAKTLCDPLFRPLVFSSLKLLTRGHFDRRFKFHTNLLHRKRNFERLSREDRCE